MLPDLALLGDRVRAYRASMADSGIPRLTSGDQGDWVAYLQRLLEYAGYWRGARPFHANGQFDDATTDLAHVVPGGPRHQPAGVADQVTWEALIDIGERPQGGPTPAPYGGQGRPGAGEGTDPAARHAMGGTRESRALRPEPFMVFSIIGLIGGLAERQERREKEAAAVEALRTTGDDYRRWTLAKAAANVLQDFLVSSDADGVDYADERSPARSNSWDGADRPAATRAIGLPARCRDRRGGGMARQHPRGRLEADRVTG